MVKSENSRIATPWHADQSGWRNPTGQWNLGVKIDPPKKLKVILLLRRLAKSAKKHTKRKLSLTQTQWHAKIRVQPLFSGVKSVLKILGECMCPYDFSEDSHIATSWHADKSGWRNPTGHWNLGVKIDPQNFWKLFCSSVRRKAPKSVPNESSR